MDDQGKTAQSGGRLDWEKLYELALLGYLMVGVLECPYFVIIRLGILALITSRQFLEYFVHTTPFQTQ